MRLLLIILGISIASAAFADLVEGMGDTPYCCVPCKITEHCRMRDEEPVYRAPEESTTPKSNPYDTAPMGT